jgi:hypothetical protein
MADATSCPTAVLTVLPDSMRDAVVSNNSHLDTAVRRRAFNAEWGGTESERHEVRAGWIALGYMMRRALPIGPLGGVTARYVPRSKVHHRDCHLLHSPVVESAPLGDIAHQPSCSVCDGPGFDLITDHLDYLWFVMAVDDVTDHVKAFLRRSQGLDGPNTVEAWWQQRRDEVDTCQQAIDVVAALAAAEHRIAKFAGDVTAGIRHRMAAVAARLSAGPDAAEIPPDDVAAKGRGAIDAWRVAQQRAPSGKGPMLAGPDQLLASRTSTSASPNVTGVIDTPRTRQKVISPRYLTGITHQRIEFARAISSAGHVRGDWDLVHPVWGTSYEWMAGKLAEKHPPSLGRALIWVIVTNSIAHDVCDSSCGNGLPVCHRFHPYPGHASLLVQVPEKRTLVSDWRGWDLLVFGGYIPIDQDDSQAFGRELTGRFGDNVPTPPHWPDDLLEKARESWIRCLRVDHDQFNRPAAGTQFVVSEIRATDVIDVVKGPPLRHAERWWDQYLADHPDEAERRERSTATLDDLRRRAT